MQVLEKILQEIEERKLNIDKMWQCYSPDVIAWQPLPAPYQPKKKK